MPISVSLPLLQELPLDRPATAPYAHLMRRHPCLDEQAHTTSGRLHLPVAPTCNIRCRFCRRGIDAHARIPGSTRSLIRPNEAVATVRRAMALCPQLQVVGVAGPGDALASEHALGALSQVHRHFPELIKCLSTNGLMLPERIDALLAAGVSTLTVTVNAIDPSILSELCASVHWQGEWIGGAEGASLLIAAQQKGIALAVEAGLFVKVNCVLVPEVNDAHVERVAGRMASLGAKRINLLPLIAHEQIAHWRAPRCEELDRARQNAARYLEVFRHCKHCRADACGIPGADKDFAGLLYGRAVEATFSHG